MKQIVSFQMKVIKMLVVVILLLIVESFKLTAQVLAETLSVSSKNISKRMVLNMAMRTFIFCLAYSPLMLAAQNLVQNGGFENNTGLPVNDSEWALVANWTNSNPALGGTPDYYHTNGIGAGQIPNTFFGTVQPFQGNAVMGMYFWTASSPNYREYITQALATPLTVGSSYTFSFQITNGIPQSAGGFGTPNIQVDFSIDSINQPVSSSGYPLPLSYTPLLNAGTMTYSENWIPMTYTFIATAPYAYFCIGNFMDDANTVTQQLHWFSNNFMPCAYYFIDDVSLTLNNPCNINLNVIGNSQICLGDSTTLNATGANTYSWSPSTGLNFSSGATVTASPSMTTTYTLTGMNGACVDTQMVIVTVNPSPTVITSGTQTTICVGTSASINATGASSYIWSPAIGLSSTTSSSVTASPINTTAYTVIGSIGNCSDMDTVMVIVNPIPTISLTNDLTIVQGSSIDLLALGGGTYSWSPASALSCTTCANPTANPLSSTTYCVEVTDNGCVSSDCVDVIVDVQCGELFVPNVFSPNADGKNDVLEVKINPNCVTDYNMVIFDRWGEKVFESNNINISWDGTYKGKTLDNAIFVYYLKITLLNTDSPILKKGNVSIIK